MPEVSIEVAAEPDRERWNRYLSTHAEAAWDHRFEWSTIVREAYRKRSFYLFAVREGTWRGVLPLVEMRGPLTGRRLVSMPYLDQGGVLADSSATAEALWRAALGVARREKLTGVHLRGSGSFVEGRSTAPTDRFRMLVELASEVEAQWSAIGPKVRNQVRKSQRQGLETRRVEHAELSHFYRIWSTNMRDLGSPPHSRRFFREVLAAFGDAAKLYLTYKGERVVAGAVCVRCDASAVVPWASALRDVRPDCPNHSLYWKVLEDAIAEGVSIFDFGRSTVDTGTYRFKKQWRATPVPVAWQSFDLAGQPIAGAGLSAESRAVALWRRLPVSISNRLGPIVRRQISN